MTQFSTFFAGIFEGTKTIMANLNSLEDIMAQIAAEQAEVSKLQTIKERLENEVVATKEELARTQSDKRKQQEKHTQCQKKQRKIQTTNAHGVCISINTCHVPNIASTTTGTPHTVCVNKTSVNAKRRTSKCA